MKKNPTNKSLDSDLEVAGVIAGLIIIVAAIAAFLDYKDGREIFMVIFGIGVIFNGIISGINWYKRQTVRGVIFMILAILFLFILAGTIIYY